MIAQVVVIVVMINLVCNILTMVHMETVLVRMIAEVIGKVVI